MMGSRISVGQKSDPCFGPDVVSLREEAAAPVGGALCAEFGGSEEYDDYAARGGLLAKMQG